MDKQTVVNQFYEIYHGKNSEIHERMIAFLNLHFNSQSKHVQACIRFSKIISESENPNGMVYGMLWNAFREVVKEKYGETKYKEESNA